MNLTKTCSVKVNPDFNARKMSDKVAKRYIVAIRKPLSNDWSATPIKGDGLDHYDNLKQEILAGNETARHALVDGGNNQVNGFC